MTEQEISQKNELLLNSILDETTKNDFVDLMEFCCINGEIEFVTEPSGDKQNEDCGIFKDVHIDQWSVGMEGDSFNGFIYASVANKWIKIPYYC